MKYYYFGDDDTEVWWWPSFFSSPKEFSIKKNHKRILFTLVALYLSYRLACILFSWGASLYRWATRSESPNDQQSRNVESQSCIIRFFEGIFVALFGLTIGAVGYYAHKQQTSILIENVTLHYRRALNEILHHTTGYDLSRSSLSPNETLLVGTLLTIGIICIMWGMLRFLMYHYVFGAALAIFGLFLFFGQFPITSKTAQTYSGTMFIIDRQHQTASIVPSLIPKFLLTITIGYYLFLALLKSFTLFLKMSFRFLVYSLIAMILLNSITSILSEQLPFETTVSPQDQFKNI